MEKYIKQNYASKITLDILAEKFSCSQSMLVKCFKKEFGTTIMNALMALDHPTADEVYECVHNEFPSISKATVYRILNRISEEGEILHLQIPGGADRFDTTLCAHHHLKCNKCGKVCDVSVPELDGIEKRIKEENGFSIGGYRIVFSGLCSDCVFKK